MWCFMWLLLKPHIIKEFKDIVFSTSMLSISLTMLPAHFKISIGHFNYVISQSFQKNNWHKLGTKLW